MQQKTLGNEASQRGTGVPTEMLQRRGVATEDITQLDVVVGGHYHRRFQEIRHCKWGVAPEDIIK